MTIRVQHKRSAVKGKIPLPADLEYGEIAVNYEATDPALYVKDTANAVRKIGIQPDATTTVKGVVQLADAAAITAGTAGLVVDAAQLKVAAFPEAPNGSVDGTIQYARQVVKAGSLQTKTWAPVVIPPGTHVGETAPAAPKQGQQWFHSGKGKLYVYYDDGTGAAQWVVANPQEAVDYSKAVQKTGITGAAILPAGTTAQRPASPIAGYLRFNSSSDAGSPLPEIEAFDGTGWRGLAYRPPAPASLPDLNLTNGQTMPVAGYYGNITVAAGATVTAAAGTFLRAQGKITINGTITVLGTIPSGPGGAGSNPAATAVAFPATSLGQGLGTNGTAYSFAAQICGSGGRGGAFRVNHGSGNGGSGGAGGGGIVLIAQDSISLSAAAKINAIGGDATAAAINPGGSGHTGTGAGGGSGGLVYLQSGVSVTLAAGAAIDVAGGKGAAGYADGTEAAQGAGGGGGGGGGFIVLNAPTITTTGAILNVLGGAAGRDASSPPASIAYLGAAGAGFAGAGGANQGGTFPNTARPGGAGLVLTDVYLY